MSPTVFFRLVGRELRGARVRALPFVASLAVGVAAVVMVAGLGDGVARAIRMEARPLLGGDVAIRSFQPIPAEVDTIAASVPGAQRVDTVDLFTMVAVPPGANGQPGRSLMGELKAVSAGWPLYGEAVVEPVDALRTLDEAGCVVEPALLTRLGVAVGDTVRIGNGSFVIRGTLDKEPGRMPAGMAAGPRVLLSSEGLERAGIGKIGARINHRALFRLPDEPAVKQLAERLRADLGAKARVETWTEAQPTAQRSVEQTTKYLGLVALLSLVVGGVGVAQATRAWMAQRLDGLAVQRVLGLTAAELRLVALAQTAVFSLAGSLLGAALGVLVLQVAPSLLEGLLPVGAINPWQPGALARGVGLGLAVALLFAVRPVDQASRVPPLRVLRRDVEPMPDAPLRAAAAGRSLLGGLYGLTWFQAGDPLLAALLTGGLLVVAGLGAGGAIAVTRVLSVLAPRVRAWWLRHGLASLGRPGSGVVPAVVSLGIGVVVVLTTVLVEGRIFAQISSEFPEAAPSVFLVDVQPDQVDGVRAAIEAAGAGRVKSAPMIVARLAAVDGVDVDTLVAMRGEETRWSLTREQRLSTMATLPEDNTIISGSAFSPGADGEVSVEQSYAENLGVAVGGTLRFDVQGVPIEMRVANIRTVSWESFNMNFFLVAEPGVLDSAPQTTLVTAQLPAEVEPQVQDTLAAKWPNVTLVSVRGAIAQARGVLERLGQGIRAVGGFTALAGVVILASGVAADAVRQRRKVALLKTLGTTRLGVVGLFVVEYGLLGLMAGTLGAVGAVGISYGVVTQMMRLPWATDVGMILGAIGVTAALSAIVGVLANLRALLVRPAEVLRGE